MWLQYRPDIVRQELQVLAEHGCTVTRSFCYWPDFVPEPGASTSRRSSTATSSTPTLTWASRRSRRSSSATCLVRTGTRRGGRVATYRDVWLVSQQAWFVGEIVRRFHGHAVAGWLLSNEMPIYGGPASTEEVTAWARILVQAARAAGATQPISIGDGAWGVEVSGTDNGYLLRSLAPLVDFFGPHSYRWRTIRSVNSWLRPSRASSPEAWASRWCSRSLASAPDFAADDHAAAYYRQVLHTSLLAGARGWLAWNNCDFDDLRHQDPYRHHVFELHFGLTDGRGQPKPNLRVLRDFASLVSELGEWGARRRRGGAGRPRALRTSPAVHRARVPERHPREPASGVHRRTGGGSPDRARPRAGRDTGRSPRLSRSLREAHRAGHRPSP